MLADFEVASFQKDYEDSFFLEALRHSTMVGFGGQLDFIRCTLPKSLLVVAMAAGYSFKKSTMYMSVVLSIFGLILIWFSSFATEPYTVVEQVRVDTSRVYANESFTLLHGVAREYAFDSLQKNISIIEIFINATNPSRFRIIDILTNETLWESRNATETVWEYPRWGILFWSPPFNHIYYFVFDNPYTAPTRLSVVITEYYLKHNEDMPVTYHRPVLDQSYAYLGAALLSIAIVIDSATLGYEEIQDHKKKLEERGIANYKVPLRD